MSYSNVEIFNGSSNPEPENFWPVVEFYPCEENFYEPEAIKQRGREWMRSNPGLGSSRTLKVNIKLNVTSGNFYEYDWSELAFYIGGATILFFVIRVSNNDEEEKTKVIIIYKYEKFYENNRRRN